MKTEIDERRTEMPPPEECFETLERLFQSRWFRDSHQLQAFLRFAVEQTLAGHEDGLKEYSIGRAVFHRGGHYDPRLDSIVRVQASLLRKKLESYYQEEGKHDRLILELPKGSYVPRFRESDGSTAAQGGSSAARVPGPQAPSSKPGRWRLAIGAFLVGAVAGGLLLQVRPGEAEAERQISIGLENQTTFGSPEDCPALWSGFIDGTTETLLTYGQPRFYSGGGLFIRDVRINSGTEQGAAEKLSRLSTVFHSHLVPNDETYTGMGELNGVVLLSHFFVRHAQPTRLDGIRSVGPEQMRGKNLILVSSLRFRTLLNTMNLPSAFEFDPGGDGGIRNLNPRPGEAAFYPNNPGTGVATSHAIVSLWPGNGSRPRILHLGGTHSWSTLAAAQYVTERDRLRQLARRLDPKGTGSPASFQILLRVEGKESVPHAIRYITHRELPAK